MQYLTNEAHHLICLKMGIRMHGNDIAGYAWGLNSKRIARFCNIVEYMCLLWKRVVRFCIIPGYVNKVFALQINCTFLMSVSGKTVGRYALSSLGCKCFGLAFRLVWFYQLHNWAVCDSWIEINGSCVMVIKTEWLIRYTQIARVIFECGIQWLLTIYGIARKLVLT